MKSLSASIALLLALSGCASWKREPQYLTFPDPPHISYRLCTNLADASPMICMSEHDASALAKWFDKLQAFEEARQRLLRD